MQSGRRGHRHQGSSEVRRRQEAGAVGSATFARSAPCTGAEGARKEVGGGRDAHRARPRASPLPSGQGHRRLEEWPLNPDVRRSGAQRVGPAQEGREADVNLEALVARGYYSGPSNNYLWKSHLT